MLEKDLTFSEMEDRNDKLSRLAGATLISVSTRFHEETVVFRGVEKDGSVIVVNSLRRVYTVSNTAHNGWDFSSMEVS